MKGVLCKAASEDCWTDFNELWVTDNDSKLNDGTTALVKSK